MVHHVVLLNQFYLSTCDLLVLFLRTGKQLLNTESHTNRCGQYNAPTWWHRDLSSWSLARILSNIEPDWKERTIINYVHNFSLWIFFCHSFYLETGWGEWYFEIHWNWWSSPFLFRISFQQLNFGRQLRLFHTGHSLDPDFQIKFHWLQFSFIVLECAIKICDDQHLLPNDCIFRGFILCLTL